MLEKITCPQCQKVLRPAKPIPPGKKVRCPQCGEVFAAQEDTDPGSKSPRPKGPPGNIKKPDNQLRKGPAPARPAPPPRETIPLAPSDDDDDDEGGTYGFKEEPLEEDRPRPKIEYAPDMSIKDLRGPAQALVIPPTNFMLRSGVLGFLGWILLLVMVLIPAVFPLSSDEGSKDEPLPVLSLGPALGAASDLDAIDAPQTAQKPPPPDQAFVTIFGVDVAAAALFGFGMFVLILSPIFLGMIWAALSCYGAVQAQNLESRGWGIAGSILTMIPYGILGMLLIKIAIVELVLVMVLGPDDTIFYYEIGILVIAILVQVAIGAWNLMILLRPEVIDGFEFVPESEGGASIDKEEEEDEDEDDEDEEEEDDDEDEEEERRSRGRAARRRRR